MEANELRLGNLCEYFIQDNVEKDYWVKNKIDIQDLELCLKEKEYFNKLYRPIPLTPEILSRCGFKRNGGEYSMELEYPPIKTVFNFPFNKGFMGDHSVYLDFERRWDTKHQYLHQLQNLYFTLTGEELTVNL